jgi:hypothetical protein
MSAILYLPLAATNLFTCLLISPFILRRVEEVTDEENRGKTSKASRTTKSVPQSGNEIQEQPAILANKRSTGDPDTKHKDNHLPVYIPVASLCVMALCAGISSRFDGSTPTATMLGIQILFSMGAGLGASQFALSGLSWTVMQSPPAKQGDNSQEENMVQPNLAIFAEMVGGSIGLAAAQTILRPELTPRMSAKYITSNFDSKIQRVSRSGERLWLEIQELTLERAFSIEATDVLLDLAIAGILFATHSVYQKLKRQRETSHESAADHPKPEPYEVPRTPLPEPSDVLRRRLAYSVRF